MTLSFVTPGPMNINAMLIHGLSAKIKPENIGRFGTGFKHAVAGILRLGGTIEVFTDQQNYEFKTEPIEHRGKKFNQVILLNKTDQSQTPCGFTTSLGLHWEPWQLYRELYSNTLDEDGEVFSSKIIPSVGKSSIIVTGLDDIHESRSMWFIKDDEKPLFENSELAIYPPHPRGGMFNQGIYILNDHEIPFRFRYNLKGSVSLSEDRTALYERDLFTKAHKILLDSCEDPNILTEIFTFDRHRFENYGFLAIPEKPSPTLIRVYERLKNQDSSSLDPSRFSRLKKAVEGERPPVQLELSEIQKIQLDKALKFLAKAGHQIDYEIEVYMSLGRRVLGQAKDGKILLSNAAFEGGTKVVAGTLLEESIHLDFGYDDESRDMQNHLLDRIISLIEKLNGEPI